MAMTYYSDERNAQILVALLKEHGITHVVASPGATNLAFLASLQHDSWFEIYSADDERHGAYMACGMAAELRQPVVLSCTGATAGRNYLPALTEAYYRKLPILAVTSSQVVAHVGQLISQVTDRRVLPADVVKMSIQVPPVYTNEQAKDVAVSVNAAILEMNKCGGGPVHINLETDYTGTFETRELPIVKKIERHTLGSSNWPELPSEAKVAVWIGSHKSFTEEEQLQLERFVSTVNGVVFCDATSSYHGKRRVFPAIVAAQSGFLVNPKYVGLHPDILIHIGEVSNDYATQAYLKALSPEVWRVNEDGVVRDRFGNLRHVFESTEKCFFEHYRSSASGSSWLYDAWAQSVADVVDKLPELPFSNLWIASQMLPRLPSGTNLHLGLSSTLQMWTAMLSLGDVRSVSNVGVCGIDGVLSSAIGASLVLKDVPVFCVLGDLSFFYDMNALGNRHIGRNLRILLVNNGCGAMFHAPTITTSVLGDAVDNYVAAGGHFGRKSGDLVRHYAEDLGFAYLSARSKEEFRANIDAFISSCSNRPILFECFTDADIDGGNFLLRETLDAYVHPRSQMISNVKRLMPKQVKNAIKAMIK